MRSLWPFSVLARARQSKRLLILRLLAQHGKTRGLELVMLSGGKLRRGTVYVWLSELEDAGLVASARREYWITDAGRTELAREVGR